MCYVGFDFAQPDKTNFAQLDRLSINLPNKLKLHIYP
ncbi:hypothetical protein CCYN2B_30032 [Capnocytophaga cynodegmi]|uniref:Uncharacterized protein n=1 Tax=Capnocytophaga cynodegmi TaxID=28189 RepID=A0A0B7HNW2_9FLAO|nr:hypothetical protein CCYN2B_30032 [Capnocytophaga cynodegmi]CEN41426.1 hypothetical protein CCYN74_690001 [Capnocytophaga cynodegmi]